MASTLTLDEALIHVQKLSRQRGFPADEDAIVDLAQGLVKACAKGVTVDELIKAVKEASPYCPTDFDLLTHADSLLSAALAWKPNTSNCKHGRCDGSGWRQVFCLVTQEGNGNGSLFTRRDAITEEVYNALKKNGLGRDQRLYTGVKRCTCKVPVDTKQIAGGDE